jgi:hypothetical protein
MGRNQYRNRSGLCSGSQPMTAQDYAALAVSLLTIGGAFIAMNRWLVKHYLQELKPNGGSSVKDQVNRLEKRLDEVYSLLLSNSDCRKP